MLTSPGTAIEVMALSKGTLNVRAGSLESSKIVGKLPQGALMSLLDRSKSTYQIDRLKDNWCKIRHLQTEGWVFCAYIGRYYRQKKDDFGPRTYLPDESQILHAKTTHTEPQGENRSVGSESSTITTYKNGIVHTAISQYEGGEDLFFFPEANLYEGFLMIQGLAPGVEALDWQNQKMKNGVIEFQHGGNGTVSVRRKGNGIEIRSIWGA